MLSEKLADVPRPRRGGVSPQITVHLHGQLGEALIVERGGDAPVVGRGD
jgi:hypothetical protein